MLTSLKKNWLGNVRADVLAGTVVALALIPEAIAFSIIAGVDPKIGLYASFTMAVTIAFAGGRPGMISAATGSMALVMVGFVKLHGLDFLFALTIVTGCLQVLCAWLKLGRYIRFVSHSVMTGFVNALAILIFLAQLPQFTGATWPMYAMVAGSLAIIYLLPRVTKAVPSSLVAIIAMTALAVFGHIHVRTVGDMGALPTALPVLHIPHVPLTFETAKIILPYAFTLTVVGLLESLLTASILDDLTDSPSDKDRECQGQGLANIVTGFFGGMAGCAMIGQSVINIKSGGRKRLSTLCAGVLLLFFILVLGGWVVRIPMAALVAVMFMVSISTFEWRSVFTLHRLPRTEAVVMVVTVVAVVLTRDLAKGVFAGVLLSAVFFTQKVAKLVAVEGVLDDEKKTRTYRVSGHLFFASADDFAEAFDLHDSVAHVVLDFTHAHVWDRSAVTAIDQVVLRFRRAQTQVDLTGVNAASAKLLKSAALHDKVELAGPVGPSR